MAGEFEVKSGNIMSSIVRSLRSGHGLVRSSQIKVRSGHVRSGQCQVSSGQVKSCESQVRLIKGQEQV